MASPTKQKARDPHPDESLSLLRAALEGGLPPLVILRGEERWYRDQGVRSVLEVATAQGLEICRHDAADPEFSLATLLDDLTGGALFASGRAVSIENAHVLLTKNARLHSPALQEALLARLHSDSPGTVVLGADKLRADHVLCKLAKEIGGVLVTCRRLWDTPPPWDPDPFKTELVQWLLARARERQVKLSLPEAAYVVGATGNDLAGLLERLKVLADGGGRVEQRVAWEAGGTPWDLAEKMVDGAAAQAVEGLEALFRSGFQGRDGRRTADAPALANVLSSALTARLREAAAGAEALASGASPGAAAVLAGVAGGPRSQATFQARVGLRSPAEWRELLEQALSVERRARSGAQVDASDFALLALRWAKRGSRRGSRR